MQRTGGKEASVGMIDSMRRDWDDRARRDAFHFIASWRTDWDEQSFFASGQEDYDRLVAPALARLRFDPQGKTMLELGCGAGRMTCSFAAHFGRVYGLDLSTEMLDRARILLREFSNVEWLLGNGRDLSPVRTASVDFVFSYIVLQHMPEARLALDYIGEMLRVLRSGGVFLFQFNNLRAPSMNWKGRAVWGLVDSVWSAGFVRASRSLSRAFGLAPELAGKSWRGAALDREAVCSAVVQAGGEILERSGEDTAMAWLGGIKK